MRRWIGWSWTEEALFVPLTAALLFIPFVVGVFKAPTVGVAIAVPAIVYDALVASRRIPPRRRERRAVRSLMGLSPVAVIVVAALLPATYPLDVPQYLQQAPDAAATRSAEAVALGQTCTVISSDPLNILPTPYQRCSWSGGVDYTVNWNSQTAMGLTFAGAGTPIDGDECIRNLGGGWWAVMPQGGDTAATGCPPSFEFQGGG